MRESHGADIFRCDCAEMSRERQKGCGLWSPRWGWCSGDAFGEGAGGGLREQAPALPGVGDAGLWGTSTNAACGTWRPAESIALTPKRQKK